MTRRHGTTSFPSTVARRPCLAVEALFKWKNFSNRVSVFTFFFPYKSLGFFLPRAAHSSWLNSFSRCSGRLSEPQCSPPPSVLFVQLGIEGSSCDSLAVRQRGQRPGPPYSIRQSVIPSLYLREPAFWIVIFSSAQATCPPISFVCSC